MNDLAELSLTNIMRILAHTGHIGPLIQCSRRMVCVAKKHRLYGYMVRGRIAVNRIARAYRFYSKFGGATFNDFDSMLRAMFNRSPPLLVSGSGVVDALPRTTAVHIITAPLVVAPVQTWPIEWNRLRRKWLNGQYHANVVAYNNRTETANNHISINLPRTFDILRTLTISSDSPIRNAVLRINTLSMSMACPSCHNSRYFSWEINVPLSALHLFDVVTLDLYTDCQSFKELFVSMRGVLLGGDRDLLRQDQGLVLKAFDAARKCNRP